MTSKDVVVFNGVSMDREFFDLVCAEPGIRIGVDPSVPYDRDYPWLFDDEGPVAPVHICVYDALRGHIRPRKPGEVIHHIDHTKSNATIANLGIGSRSAHALSHAIHRQKFTFRKRDNLFGWHRPRAEAPEREISPTEKDAYKAELLERQQQEKSREHALRKSIRAALEKSRALAAVLAARRGEAPSVAPCPQLSLEERLKNAEQQLAMRLPGLRQEVDHLDSGDKIPPPISRPRKGDRIHGIKCHRRGCTPGEAALVRLLVKHRFDLDAVLQDAPISRATLDEMLQRHPVSRAISIWHKHRRLPPPCSAKKLRPYVAP